MGLCVMTMFAMHARFFTHREMYYQYLIPFLFFVAVMQYSA